MPPNASSELTARQSALGISLVTIGAATAQLGASFAALALPALGIAAVVLVRQLVMAVIHVPLAHRSLRAAGTRDPLWGVALAVPLMAMNAAIYAAIREMGVGLAVTVEFLGPLALSVLATRSRLGLVCALMGLVGMLCVTGPSGSATWLGTGFALLAASSWAAYLALSRAAGRRLTGLAPSAVAALTSVLVLTPIVLLTLDATRVTASAVGFAVAAGLLTSAVPYALDVIVLRILPLGLVSLLMSVHPACAALAGALVLGERLSPVDVAGLLLISGANVMAVRASLRRPAPGAAPAPADVEAAAEAPRAEH
ncbi:EamA family transporter [Brachybacterium sp. EF45031]|uniref:EamA family transporter n=1 Tax=Brachybacterium sillae TaxID=2810536 RepID=UPI00217DFC13|nr:EamA family transporter [Brachybacterium sillae]MCS6710733.1 EamA family transporter [Brachybacterium sillae]